MDSFLKWFLQTCVAIIVILIPGILYIYYFGSKGPLTCYHCQSVKNWPGDKNYPTEADCWANPRHTMICKDGEYCASFYQESPKKITKKIVRSCTNQTGAMLCYQDTNVGLVETFCRCEKNLCIATKYDGS